MSALSRWPLALALALGTPGSVWAQPSSAETLLREGVRARLAGDDGRAERTFTEAYARCGCAEALAQRALARLALGRFLEAEADLGAALRAASPWVDRNRRELEEAARSLAQRLGTLELLGVPEGAAVRVEGAAREGSGPGPLRARVEPGALRVEVAARGSLPWERRVLVEPGGTTRVQVRLSPAPQGARRAQVTVAPAREGPWRRLALASGVSAAALAASGGLLLGLGQGQLALYDDDTRCLVGSRTREQNCGAQRALWRQETAAAAGALGLGAFALLATGYALLRLRSEAAAARAPTAAVLLDGASVRLVLGGAL